MDDLIPKVEIRIALGNILSSDAFGRSPLLSKFLKFVVEESLAGNEHLIKEYTVGTQVLNKAAGFNPQTDASVRINAIRLRKMLAEYYHQQNGNTCFRIDLPKGSYKPSFSQKSKSGEILSHEPQNGGPEPADIVGILPFTGFTHQSSLDFSISGFCEFLSQKLSMFQDIKVVSFHSVSRFMDEDGRLEHIAKALGLSYYLSGSIELGNNQLQVSYQLVEANTNAIIWSQQTETSLLSTSLEEATDTISSQIVASLAGYSGFIHYRKLLYQNQLPPLSNKMANAIFWFYHYQVHHTSSLFYQAIERLEAVVDEDGNCALCLAVLAHLYSDALIYNYKTTKDPLETAQAYVEKAFKLDPICQHAHLVKGWIHILKREKEEASDMLEKTNQLNHNSSTFKAMCSLGMALIGEYEKSLDYLKKVKRLNPLPYWWMNVPEIFVALKNKEYNRVIFLARKSSTPPVIFEHVFEMIGLYYQGEIAKVKALAKVYKVKYPDGIAFLMQALPAILLDDELAEIIRSALQNIETDFLQ